MSFISGVAGQSGRNLVLEPFLGANTRSPSGATRNGEITADAAFIGGGLVTAGAAARVLRDVSMTERVHGGRGLVGALMMGAAAVGIADGIKNLFAKLPSVPDDGDNRDPGRKHPTHGPAPTTPPAGPGQGPGSKPVTHTVRPGETLSFIADCFQTKWRDLYSYNRKVVGPNPDVLKVGERLRIPPKNYGGKPFSYRPTAVPGILPDGVYCDPKSPKGQGKDCPAPK